MYIGLNTSYSHNYTTKPENTDEIPQRSHQNTASNSPQNKEQLSEDEKRVVKELQARDTQVKAHEAAHQSGGAATGGATFSYQKGPDGKMYAIGGEVPISFHKGSTPQETIANARAVIASALAPADPSAQDMAVASSATMMMLKAQQELAKEQQDKLNGEKSYNDMQNTKNDTQNKLDISI